MVLNEQVNKPGSTKLKFQHAKILEKLTSLKIVPNPARKHTLESLLVKAGIKNLNYPKLSDSQQDVMKEIKSYPKGLGEGPYPAFFSMKQKRALPKKLFLPLAWHARATNWKRRCAHAHNAHIQPSDLDLPEVGRMPIDGPWYARATANFKKLNILIWIYQLFLKQICMLYCQSYFW